MQEHGQPGAPVYAAREMNGLAIASFVVSLVGLCSPLGILGIIFGYIAKSQIRTRNNSGGGLATAGIVLGWISLLGMIAIVAAIIAGGGWERWGEWQDKYTN